MQVRDPGHKYALDQLDDVDNHRLRLDFVKRMGEKYPGNKTSSPGTNLQEVFRACIDRICYLNNQERDWRNETIIHDLRMAIWLLEVRAAERHNRKLSSDIFDKIEKESTCRFCGHICCGETCVQP
jgi:rubrerythrin